MILHADHGTDDGFNSLDWSGVVDVAEGVLLAEMVLAAFLAALLLAYLGERWRAAE